MKPDEIEMFEMYRAMFEEQHRKFWVRFCRALKDPFAVMNRHWHYNARPLAATRHLRDDIRAWQETQKDLPEHEQEKLVIYTCWTSLLDNL